MSGAVPACAGLLRPAARFDAPRPGIDSDTIGESVSGTPDPTANPTATPTGRTQPLRTSGFSTLLEALEYAAGSGTGVNFHDGRGRLTRALSWGEVRDAARAAAHRLAGFGLPRGSQVGIIAETVPDFPIAFFACRYAGLTPVPLPATVHLGGQRQFVDLLARMLRNADARICLGSEAFQPFLEAMPEAQERLFQGSLDGLLERDPSPLPAAPGADDLAYIQYTSGSTRFPRGAMLTERSTLRNVTAIIEDGLELDAHDRFCSWLPLYHDMGLVGKMIVPMVSQSSIDYLGTREFAMRPRLWLRLLSENRSTISFAPPFGYELTARRLRAGDAEGLDLSHWRVAGCGADMIRPETLERFADALAPAGFDRHALLPSYGMAEVSLAVSFTPTGAGLKTDSLDSPCKAGSATRTRFTRCGRPLPGYRVEIRDEDGNVLPERREGTIHLNTPSTMEGYYAAPEINAQVLHDGWLDTGDLGYLVDGELVITGRRKDLMIINGRNIWPQDVEHVAELQPGVRSTDAAAFTVDAEDGSSLLVVLLQCREQDDGAREQLLRAVRRDIQAEFGVEARVHAVPPHSLPRTTSGKLSRAQARLDYLSGLGQPA